MIVDKKNFQGPKTKSMLQNLIFPQRGFVCWWNLRLDMPDYRNPFMQVCLSMHDLLFHPARKG